MELIRSLTYSLKWSSGNGVADEAKRSIEAGSCRASFLVTWLLSTSWVKNWKQELLRNSVLELGLVAMKILHVRSS